MPILKWTLTVIEGTTIYEIIEFTWLTAKEGEAKTTAVLPMFYVENGKDIASQYLSRLRNEFA